MIFAFACTIGVATSIMRSAVSLAIVGFSLVAVFLAACVLSANPVSVFPLVLAVLGYNAGICVFLVASMVFESRREA